MLPEFLVVHRWQLRHEPSNCLFSCEFGLRHLDYELASFRADPFTLCSPEESSKPFCAEKPRTAAKASPNRECTLHSWRPEDATPSNTNADGGFQCGALRAATSSVNENCWAKSAIVVFPRLCRI